MSILKKCGHLKSPSLLSLEHVFQWLIHQQAEAYAYHNTSIGHLLRSQLLTALKTLLPSASHLPKTLSSFSLFSQCALPWFMFWSWDSGARGTAFPRTGHGEERKAEALWSTWIPEVWSFKRGRSTVLKHLMAFNSLKQTNGYTCAVLGS